MDIIAMNDDGLVVFPKYLVSGSLSLVVLSFLEL